MGGGKHQQQAQAAPALHVVTGDGGQALQQFVHRGCERGALEAAARLRTQCCQMRMQGRVERLQPLQFVVVQGVARFSAVQDELHGGRPGNLPSMYRISLHNAHSGITWPGLASGFPRTPAVPP